jgi:hypothetical protein
VVDAVALIRSAMVLGVGVVVMLANVECVGTSSRAPSRRTGSRVAGRSPAGLARSADRRSTAGRTAPSGAAISPIALERALTDYQARLAALVDRGDLSDSLYFGWFDRPYQRATLACAVKALAVLERELRLRRSGNGAMGDGTLGTMLRWLDDAMDRACAEPRTEDFLPDRIRNEPAAYGPGGEGPPLFGFVDRASFTRQDHWFGDLDLLACCGFRVYARPPRVASPADIRRIERQRCASLGLIETLIMEPDQAPDSRYFQLRPGCLADFLQRSWSGNEGSGADAIALIDPPEGETWAESLARRALYRGATQGDRPVVYGWEVPGGGASHSHQSERIRAAMWVHACEGQKLALLEGWRDLRDGSRLPYAALITAPQCVETIAHTALDILRHARFLERMGRDNLLAILVDESVVDPDEPNRWSPEFARVAAALHERQIPFDLVPRALAGDREWWAAYEMALALPPFAGDPGPAGREIDVHGKGQLVDVAAPAEVAHSGWTPARFANWVEGLLRDQFGSPRVAVLTADGRPERASDVYVRAARDADDVLRIALVNLSSHSRSVTVRCPGYDGVGSFVDVLDPGRELHASEPIPLDAWQVRLLVSRGPVGLRAE